MQAEATRPLSIALLTLQDRQPCQHILLRRYNEVSRQSCGEGNISITTIFTHILDQGYQAFLKASAQIVKFRKKFFLEPTGIFSRKMGSWRLP
jgi:hypothetical protein